MHFSEGFNRANIRVRVKLKFQIFPGSSSSNTRILWGGGFCFISLQSEHLWVLNCQTKQDLKWRKLCSPFFTDFCQLNEKITSRVIDNNKCKLVLKPNLKNCVEIHDRLDFSLCYSLLLHYCFQQRGCCVFVIFHSSLTQLHIII